MPPANFSLHLPSEHPLSSAPSTASLSHHVTTLSATLARRRADLALLRAEAATVAFSLESAKHRLDTALRDESVIRATAPPSPRPFATRADHQPDQGLVRALSGQLDVTRSALRDATSRRDALRAELSTLQNSVSVSLSPTASVTNITSDSIIPTSTTSAPEPIPTSSNSKSSSPSHPPVRPTFEDSVHRVLLDGVTVNTSFRSDHVHIWRDATMPNLMLLGHDAAPTTDDTKRDNLSLGVVTERIFEGVTCFTPTSQDVQVPSSDLRLDSHGSPRAPDEDVANRVAKQFAVLSAPAVESGAPDTRLLAPRVALDRVLNLIRDPDGSSSARGRSWRSARLDKMSGTTPTSDRSEAVVEGETDVVSSEKNKSDVPSSEPSQNAPQTPKLPPPKLSHSSSVLSLNQFAGIVADGVPIRFHESALNLLYSTDQHGMSLRTLYNRVRTASPTLVVIRDTRGRVFGCYGAQPWKSSATRYYGSGESFVFGALNTESVRVYKWSRENSFFQFTSGTFLAIGGGAGSHFALWVDEDLLMGTTSACSTFSSPPLTDLTCEDPSDSLEFKILSLEVWGFGTRSSR